MTSNLPTSVTSPVLGEIRIERSSDLKDLWIQGSCTHRGQNVEVLFLCIDVQEFRRLLPLAEQFWKQRVRHFKTFREYAAIELLGELNACLDCGQPDPLQFTQNKLRKTLRMPSGLMFYNGGSESDYLCCSVGFGDDKLMEYEYICVRIDQEGHVIEGEVESLL